MGLLLADAGGVLHLLAATSEEARKVEAFQLQRDEGPCLDCYQTGAPVSVADLRTQTRAVAAVHRGRRGAGVRLRARHPAAAAG